MDGCGERDNRVRPHDFFNFGNVAVASTEHGREPQRTRATAYASHSTDKKRVAPHSYGDGGRILVVVSFLLLRWRQGGLGVEMGCCLNYWQWDADFDGSPLLDRKLGRCCGRGTAVVSLVLEEWSFLG